jgi:hypothetical protein
MRISLISLPLLALSLAACAADESAAEVGQTEQSLAGDTNYLIVYKSVGKISTAQSDVTTAGGTLLASYPYGVVVASSADPNFAANIKLRAGVRSVAATGGTALAAVPTEIPYTAGAFLPAPAPAAANEELSSYQWNMDMIRAKQARAVTRGKRSVVVGVMDSGIDDSQPDLDGQVDYQRSVTCVGGVADPSAASWSNDWIGHGTHVAGIIGAKDDGLGVVGVAPGASLAAIKVVDDSGLIFPEAFLCGLHWAATHDVQVANASLFLDPNYYWCGNDPAQATVIEAVQRAVRDASKRGTTVFVSAGNESQDLRNKTVPYSDPPETVDDSCKYLPLEMDGVIGVSAVGPTSMLAHYSSYGYNVVHVAAPGGDDGENLPVTAQILSTLPVDSYYYWAAAFWGGRFGTQCPEGLDLNADIPDYGSAPLAATACGTSFGWLDGTSQAAPHATGVAALAISKYGNMSTSTLLDRFENKSTEKSCRDTPNVNCRGDKDYNGVYGYGIIDAYRMVGGR